jgi:hypothetical protein
MQGGIEEEVNQRPSSSRAAQPSAAQRADATSTPGPRRTAPAAAGPAGLPHDSGAALLTGARVLDAGSARQASPYSGAYDTSPASSEGGSVGEVPAPSTAQAEQAGRDVGTADLPPAGLARQPQQPEAAAVAESGLPHGYPAAIEVRATEVEDTTSPAAAPAFPAVPGDGGDIDMADAREAAAPPPAQQAAPVPAAPSPAPSLGGLALLAEGRGRGEEDAASEDVLSQYTSRQGSGSRSLGIDDSREQQVEGPQGEDEVTSGMALLVEASAPAARTLQGAACPSGGGDAEPAAADGDPGSGTGLEAAAATGDAAEAIACLAGGAPAGEEGGLAAPALKPPAVAQRRQEATPAPAAQPAHDEEATAGPAAVLGAKLAAAAPPAAAASALPQLSPLELAQTRPGGSAAVAGPPVPHDQQQEQPPAAAQARPAGRLTEGKVTVPAALMTVAATLEVSPG